MPDVSLRRLQAFQAFVRIFIAALNVHPNFRRAAIVGDMDSGNADQADARIGQLAFHQGFDLFAEGLADPPTMIFEPALLHSNAPRVKRLRISEIGLRCAARSAIVALFRWVGVSTEVTSV